MNDFFSELFAYSHHYNQQLAALFAAHPDTISDKAMKLFSHIVNAHQIWNARIIAQPPGTAVWEEHDMVHIALQDNKNYADSLAILNNTDLDSIIDYTNSRGEAFTNTVRDILFHVINHSTYHRAQIATEMKQAGIAPLTTDYIFYKR